MICCWRVLLTIDSTSLWQWSLCFVASTLVPFFASEAASFIYLQSGASVSPGWKKTLLLVHSLQFKAFPDSSVNLEATISHHLHNKIIIPTCHSVSTLDGPDGQKSQGFTKYLLSSNRINSPVTYSRCWTVWVFYFNSDRFWLHINFRSLETSGDLNHAGQAVWRQFMFFFPRLYLVLWISRMFCVTIKHHLLFH